MLISQFTEPTEHPAIVSHNGFRHVDPRYVRVIIPGKGTYYREGVTKNWKTNTGKFMGDGDMVLYVEAGALCSTKREYEDFRTKRTS